MPLNRLHLEGCVKHLYWCEGLSLSQRILDCSVCQSRWQTGDIEKTLIIQIADARHCSHGSKSWCGPNWIFSYLCWMLFIRDFTSCSYCHHPNVANFEEAGAGTRKWVQGGYIIRTELGNYIFPVIKLSCFGLKVPLQADKIIIVLITQNNLDLDGSADWCFGWKRENVLEIRFLHPSGMLEN